MGGDDVVLKAVNLSNYGNVVDYGSGNSTNDLPGSGSPASDPITYTTPSDIALFTPTGTLINPEASGSYVYLSNNKGTSYAAGTPNLGDVIVLRKWNGSA